MLEGFEPEFVAALEPQQATGLPMQERNGLD